MAHVDVRQRRKMRIRKKIVGTIERPRLCVFRSLNHIYVQAVDDGSGRTVASASSLCEEVAKSEAERSKADTAFEVGKLIAARCKAKGILKVVFDRGGYLYHGRVAKVAAGARDGGLVF